MTSNDAFVVGIGQFLQGMTDLKEGLSVAEGNGLLAEEGQIPPSPLMQNIEALLAMLLEHSDNRPDGRCLIPAPVATLQARAHLLQSEAVTVLDVLVQQKLIEKIGDWESALVLQPTSPRAEKQATVVTQYRPLPAMPSMPKATKPASSERVVRKPQVTAINWAELYAQLKGRAIQIDSDLLLRGAVPVMQNLARVNEAEAIRRLEWLRDHGHIQERDGWRFVALLSDVVVQPAEPSVPEKTDDTPIAEPRQLQTPRHARTRRRSFRGTRRIGSIRPQLPATPLDAPSITVPSPPTPPPVVSVVVDDLEDTAAQEVARLQQQVASLQQNLREAQEKLSAIQSAQTDYKVARQKLSDLVSNGEGPREKAKAFLLNILADGPKLSREVQQAAEQAGISAKTLTRAQGELGVVSTPRGREGQRGAEAWYMSLPPT